MEKRDINISTSTIFKVIAVILGLWLLYVIKDIIVLFFISVVIMAAIEPAVKWFQRKNIHRTGSVLIIYVILFSILGISFSLLIPALVSQFQKFVQDLPRVTESLVNSFGVFKDFVQSQDIDFSVQGIFGNVGSSGIFSTTVGFFSGLLSFVVVLSMAFYMSVKEDGMERFLRSIIPTGYEEYGVKIGNKIKNKIGKWMLGQIFLMFVIFALDYVVLYFLDVPYALVLAIIGGLLEIIPYLGPTISTILAFIVGLLISPIKGFLVLALYILIQMAENNIIVPQIMKKAVGLNPLAVILALLIGAKIAGVLGAILAIPVATGIGVMVEELIARKDAKAGEV